jgi:hypothetical protein
MFIGFSDNIKQTEKKKEKKKTNYVGLWAQSKPTSTILDLMQYLHLYLTYYSHPYKTITTLKNIRKTINLQLLVMD